MGKLYLGTQEITPFVYDNQGGGGGNEPGGNIKITAYDTTTGVISGGGFGSTAGTVYVLDRDTNTYVAQTVSSWEPASITLSSPVDLTTLEGTTSMAVVASDGTWSNKWLLTGDVAVSGWGKLYLQNPDTRAVYTLAVTSQTDFEKLYGVSGGYSRQIVIGSDTFYTDKILGFQFGSDFSLATLGDYFLGYCVNLMQPIVLPVSVEAIGNRFLESCFKFDQPILFPTNLETIGDYFIEACYSFNQPISLPNTVQSLGTNFMRLTRSFNQPLILPDSITSIGNSFSMSSSFNQTLTLPSGLTSLGDSFMNGASAFNQPFTFPSGITSIGASCFAGCSNFDQTLTLPSELITLGDSFMSSCVSFDQPLSLPPRLTIIGAKFMAQCSSFSQPLVIPSSVGSFGTSESGTSAFMYNCYAFTDLTVNISQHPSGNNYILATNNNLSKMYIKGVTVKGTGRSYWISALGNRTSSPYRKLIDGGE